MSEQTQEGPAPLILPPEGASSQAVERMAIALRDLGYDDSATHELIQAAYVGAREVDKTSPAAITRSKRILVTALRELGFDPATAVVLAATLGALSGTKLTLDAGAAADILGTNFTTLKNHRDTGRLVPWISHPGPNKKTATNIYSLHQVLHAAAWRDLNPHTGGQGKIHMPSKF